MRKEKIKNTFMKQLTLESGGKRFFRRGSITAEGFEGADPIKMF